MRATAIDAFGWPQDVVLTAGPRGALGQVWRADVGSKSFALKEIFAEPPDVEAELAFTARVAEAGVRFPASHPGRDGRYLIDTPAGTWLRLYDWIDLRPATPAPEELGALLARLHRCAPAAAGEQNPWYHSVSEPHDFAGWLSPPDPGALILCHRDLHPDNVLADPIGDLAVVDWDNFGPADPARELACALFDWLYDGGPNLNAMRRMYNAYVRAGGPGRLSEPGDFTMLVAIRLNFVRLQSGIPGERAAREVAETLRLTPTAEQLHEVLEMCRACA